ncbi:kinase-like domain-containing protein [Rhizophagus irregularis DAOM 181602=DAOM 197198]|nr:kinase-like domain-containing protein [Rhizophagus irregularis DAOM 181602=DAOM 197198]
MANIRYELIFSTLNKSKSLIDLNIHNNLEKKYEYIKQIILNDEEILTKDEKIIEWIPYNSLQNTKYLTEGGYSKIYTADWIDGEYFQWNNQERKLKRFGKQEVILKRLENGESTNRNWFDESLEPVKSHLTLSNKWSGVVKCYGLTKDPSDGNYMLVIQQMNMDLREYLQQNPTEIMNGMRPKIMSSTPLEYKKLMEQCWHADPTKRPDINSLHNKIFEIRKLYYQNNQYENNKQHQTCNDNIVTSSNYTSATSIYSSDNNSSKFGNLLEIRTVTEAHRSQDNFSIPNKIEDIGNNSLSSKNN